MNHLHTAFLDELVKLSAKKGSPSVRKRMAGLADSTAGQLADIATDVAQKGKQGAQLAWRGIGPAGRRGVGSVAGIGAIHQLMNPDATAMESLRSGGYMAGGSAAGRAAANALDLPRGSKGRLAAGLLGTALAGRAAYKTNKEKRREKKKKEMRKMLEEMGQD